MLRAALKTLLVPALLAPAAGCEWLRKMGLERDNGTQVQTGPIQAVTAPELVGYLNRQAANLQSVRYNDLSIEVSMGKEHHTLKDSTLICAKPRNFLLVGGRPVLGELVQIGSNDREFWMLTRSPLEPTYVYCSHADFQNGRGRLPIPFDPDWALEALGMATYDTGLPYRVETDQRRGVHVLTVDTTTPQGVPVKKSVVLEPNPPEGRPHVRQHLILDANNKTVAAAEIKEAVTLPVGSDAQGKTVYVQVPTRVSLEWPQQQVRMELKLGRPKVNERMTEAEAAQLFSRPTRSDVRPVNLAEVQYTPSARGATPDNNSRGRFGLSVTAGPGLPLQHSDLLGVFEDAAGLDDRGHLAERPQFPLVAGRPVQQLPGRQVHPQVVPGANLIHQPPLGLDRDEVRPVYCVAVEDAGVEFGDHAPDARSSQGDRGVLAARPAAEILPGHDDFVR